MKLVADVSVALGRELSWLLLSRAMHILENEGRKGCLKCVFSEQMGILLPPFV